MSASCARSSASESEAAKPRAKRRTRGRCSTRSVSKARTSPSCAFSIKRSISSALATRATLLQRRRSQELDCTGLRPIGMTNRSQKKSRGLIAAMAVPVAVTMITMASACSQSSDALSSSTAASALSSAIVAETSASGTLICAPAQVQIDACSGKAASDSCSLTSADGGSTVAGTCRTTVDGQTVACAPNPPAPPQALVDACAGKAKGDSCTGTERDGDTLTGACGTLTGSDTLVCLRVHDPPQVAVDACTGLVVNDACTLPGHDDGRTIAGTCTNGPTGTATLACSRARAKADATAACVGLADGAACTLTSHRDSVTGTCTTPAAGGSAVCVVARVDLRGALQWPRGPDGDRARGHRGGPP